MTYSVVARNFSEAHDNKIHSDEIAKKYGFSGALVPGVAVFGHLVHPMVAAHGARWLSSSVSRVRFAQPAYHGDTLRIEHTQPSADAQRLSEVWPDCALNERSVAYARGESISTLDSRLLTEPPAPLTENSYDNPPKPDGRPEMTWDVVEPRQPFSPWDWEITADGNQRYANEVADENALYQEYAHPHWILSIANSALTREYLMPAWIHVGSEMCLRSPLCVGDQVTVRAVPLEKWERKGHQFVRLYLTYHRGTELTSEVMHTAIFRVAE